MELSDAVSEFKRILRLKEAYRRALCVMSCDNMTSAPKNSAAGYAASSAVLSGKSYELTAGREFGDLVGLLCNRADELDEITRREAEEQMREYELMRRIPEAEYVSYKRLLGVAFSKWQEAKRSDDFELFRPYLDEVFSGARRMAELASPGTDPLDHWLDRNERGTSREMLDDFFGRIRGELVPLIKRISRMPKPEAGFLHRTYPKAGQRAFSDEIMQLMGIDRDRCSIAEVEHPYTTFISRDDVRITTHYYENDVSANMFSVLHEGGHALYELNISPELSGSPLAHGASAGMHESISRFFENIVGRSEAFSRLIFPRLRARFPEQLSGVSAEQFHRAVNRVEPTLKRTQADELTYCLHIMIRYELEKLLLSGRAQAGDVPGLWRELSLEYLGIDVPSDSLGCLQDMHWGSGLIGYFPTYALGNAYGAQIFAAMRRELDTDALIESGRIPELTAWLAERICRFGKLRTPARLIESACGESFDPGYYIRYLTEKYGALYGV